ncbi:MAG: zinc-ribbon domain containing protein [Chloroflexi bacterium]|nr:zinc-ribbon domain containing protein [Chloroflexota bacterium]
MALADKSLTCRDCGATFAWTAGEQEFYQRRGLLNEPTRCPQCRAQRRRSRGEQDQGTRQMYPAVCAQCGAETQVPFQPRLGRPVYCSDCFSTIRSAGPRSDQTAQTS